MRRVIQPSHYKTATWGQVSSAIRTLNRERQLRAMPDLGVDQRPDILLDLAAVEQGGELVPLPALEKRLRGSLPDAKEWNKRAHEILATADVGSAPGPTPLHRAVTYMCLLNQASGGDSTQSGVYGPPENSGGEGQGEGEGEGGKGKEGNGPPQPGMFATPEYAPHVSPKAVESVNDALEKANKAVGNMMDETAPGWSTGDLNAWENKVLELAASQLSHHLLDALDRAGRVLDSHTESMAQPEIKFREDPDGTVVSSRNIAGPHEVGLLMPAHKAMLVQNPHFGAYLMAQGEGIVVPRGMLKTRKQLCVMAVDTSGSMQELHIAVAFAIVNNRMEYAQQGQAEVWVYTFNEHAGRPIKLDENSHYSTRGYKTALQNSANPFGGGTSIYRALEQAKNAIQLRYDQADHVAPELILITDGFSDYFTEMSDPDYYKLKDGTPWKMTYIMLTRPGEMSCVRYPEFAKGVRTMQAGKAWVMSEYRQRLSMY